MYIAGVLPATIYGTEHELWSETNIAGIKKPAVTAIRPRSPGVPFAVEVLTLPAAADP